MIYNDACHAHTQLLQFMYFASTIDIVEVAHGLRRKLHRQGDDADD